MKPITSADPQSRSADEVADNVARLRELFPEAFAEGKVDFDVLKQLLGGAVDEREEKYGLNWHEKRRARQLALTPSTGTLRPCRKDSLGDWDTTRNLMIEGDNLEVLKLLQKSYSGKVKLIYIDPPYNTGNDFVYPDDFRDNIANYKRITNQGLTSNTETSGRFHTNWLNMIYPRLKLARNLLTEDGVVLISIDDAEVENMRRVCHELFGEENMIACMVWEKGRKNDAKLISVGHEYLLVVAKSLATLRERNTLWREEKPGAREIWEKYVELRRKHGVANELIEIDLQAWFSELPKSHPSKKWSRYKRVDANGPWRDRDISWPGGGGPKYDVIHPKTGKPCMAPEDGWRFSKPEEMQRQIKLGLVEFREDHTEPPFRKAHIRPIPDEVEGDVATVEDETENGDETEFATQVRGSYFYAQSQVTVKYLKKILGPRVFNNPKDHSELAKVFNYVTSGDRSCIIMDFFAGSGSAGQAVMEMNQTDDGTRRYILVQLPEPLDPAKNDQKPAAAFCDKLGKPRAITEITKERLRRAAKEYQTAKPSLSGSRGFRVYKLDSSNIRPWNPNAADIGKTLLDAVEHIEPGREDEDVLTELLLKLGLDLCVPVEPRTIANKSVHSVGGGVLLVCLASSVSAKQVEPLALGIAAWHKELAPAGESQVVFRDAAFADDVAKTNLTAILAQHGLNNVRSL